jgi:hypothetical protein
MANIRSREPRALHSMANNLGGKLAGRNIFQGATKFAYGRSYRA